MLKAIKIFPLYDVGVPRIETKISMDRRPPPDDLKKLKDYY
jgi:hypothetical protein